MGTSSLLDHKGHWRGTRGALRGTSRHDELKSRVKRAYVFLDIARLPEQAGTAVLMSSRGDLSLCFVLESSPSPPLALLVRCAGEIKPQPCITRRLSKALP